MIGAVFGFALGCVFTGALVWMVVVVAVESAKKSAKQAVQAAAEAKAAAAQARQVAREVSLRTRAPQLKAAAGERRAALLGSVHAGLVQLERHKRAAEPSDRVPPGHRA